MPKLPLNRDRAWAYVLLNLSVPGWGSLKAGKIFAGVGEIIILFAGLSLLGAWMFQWMNRVFQSELENPLPPVPAAWLWKWGVGLVGVSCIWTIVSCISLMREARANERNCPPRLSELPKPPKL
ncbi:MAG TPA: hypothetical protein VH280_08295 [Verrucomicrobiae bacterium]|jgi:hypothetical protein|nr:hypothetical protein [Verrucomicrobiae bacterium]